VTSSSRTTGAVWYGGLVDSHLGESAGPGVLSLARQTQLLLDEPDGPARVILLRTQGTDGTVSVDYATVDESAHAGVDYEHRSGTFTFAPGERLKVLDIPILDNAGYSAQRNFRLELTNPSGTSIQGVTSLSVSIWDDEPPPVTPSLGYGYTNGTEGSPSYVNASLSNTSYQAVTLRVRTFSGTATSGVDFEAIDQTVTIPAGQLAAHLTLALIDDSAPEDDETFTVEFTELVGATYSSTPMTFTMTIPANDGFVESEPLPIITVDDTSVLEDTFARFHVNLSAPATNVVKFKASASAGTATAGADFAPVTRLVTIPVGETTAFIEIPIVNDPFDEQTETFDIALYDVENAVLASTTARGRIIDDDASLLLPEVSLADMSVSERDGSATFTLRLSFSGPVNTVVSYATMPGTATVVSDFLQSSGMVTFLPGETTKAITVPVVNDSAIEPDEKFSVRLFVEDGGFARKTTATGTILNDDRGRTRFARH
jgi:hypothetical protein